MQGRRRLGEKVLAAAAAAVTVGGLVGGVAAPASAAAADHVYVARHASPTGAGHSCDTAAFSSINAAVAAVAWGGKVVVCPGTYAEDVVVNKSLTLIGRHATIDATGLENAVQVVRSHVTVSGFTLKNAQGEGLLVGVDSLADAGLLPKSSPVLRDVTVDHVAAVNNDKGFNGTENGNCKYPGDCGGGIHFNVVKGSTLRDSTVSGNADGILLTDDYGPNAHNVIEGNRVTDNRTECGIVLPSHSSDAVSFDPQTMAVTGRNPDLGGVYGNVIRNNVLLRNGTAKAPPQFGGGGSGAGVGIFGSGPGSGAYDNLVQGNFMAGNGLAGFTIHAHHPGGEDVNGNDVVNNTFGTNNLGGDGFDGGVSNFVTTAIAVYSVPTVKMAITGNVIRANAVGIWLTDTVTATGLHHNRFHHVTTRVVVQPAT